MTLAVTCTSHGHVGGGIRLRHGLSCVQGTDTQVDILKGSIPCVSQALQVCVGVGVGGEGMCGCEETLTV